MEDYKMLLTKDVCARLPYDLLEMNVVTKGIISVTVDINDDDEYLYDDKDGRYKPILIPYEYLKKQFVFRGEKVIPFEKIDFDSDCAEASYIDVMNQYMIDYRGLINKGLAVSAFSIDYNPYE